MDEDAPLLSGAVPPRRVKRVAAASLAVAGALALAGAAVYSVGGHQQAVPAAPALGLDSIGLDEAVVAAAAPPAAPGGFQPGKLLAKLRAEATTKCKAYKCPTNFCPVKAKENNTVPVLVATAQCCTKPTCCQAPIATCIACRTCTTTANWCAARVSKWVEGCHKVPELHPFVMPKFEVEWPKGKKPAFLAAPGAGRRLDENTSKSEEPIEWVDVGKDWQSRAADAAKENTPKAELDADKLLEAEQREQEQLGEPEPTNYFRGHLAEKFGNWSAQWEQVLAQEELKKRGWFDGCTPSPTIGGCPYYIQSIFCLHHKHGGSVNTVAVLADTVHAVSCDNKGVCWVWDVYGAKPRQVFAGHTGPVYTVNYLANADLLFTGGAADHAGGRFSGFGEGLVWNWRNGNPRAKFVTPGGPIFTSANIPGRQRVVVGGAGKGPVSLDWGSNLPATLFFGPGPVNSVSYVPSAVAFVSGHGDGKVRYWNALTGELLMVICAHKGPVTAVAGSPTYFEAWSAGEDGTIKLWNLQTGLPIKFFTQAYAGPITSLAVFPGGQMLAVGSNDDNGTVRLWQRDTGILSCQIRTGAMKIRALAISPSNPMGSIFVASEDGYVRVFAP